MRLLKPSMETTPVILQNDVPLRGCGCTIKSFKAIILKLGLSHDHIGFVEFNPNSQAFRSI